jgi:cephalosporin hydroxylase
MEIGTNQGGTLLVLCRMADPQATVVSVDLPHSRGGKFGGGYTSFQVPIFKMFATGRQKLHLLRADSHSDETLKSVSSLVADKQLDFLFIDGDHTYDGVKADFEMYSPFVRKGGIVAFHDIAIHPQETGCAVHLFWNEVKKQYQHSEIVSNKDQGWAGIGILTV